MDACIAVPESILDYVYAHEVQIPEHIFLTQPTGFGSVTDYTWHQVLDESRRMAAHLRSCGFEDGARIAILSNNCAHFILAELAIWMAGMTTVAVYPTEKPETIRYVLEHSEASLLFIGKLDGWESQLKSVTDSLPCVAFPLAPETGYQSWDAILAKTSPLIGSVQRANKDIALICYTSGSTGQPKGVMHSFEKISDTSTRIVAFLKSVWGTNNETRVLSYLPLAHVFERAWIECASLVDGNVQIYFTESSQTFLQDLHRARPTSFISVPRLWQKFQQSVLAKLPQVALDRLLDAPSTSTAVAKQVLQGLGLEQVISASSGSAPISVELLEWYRRLGLNLLEGYGMTEDFAYSFTSTPEFNEVGYVGVPLPGVEARLTDEGEILIKSPGQLVGYYKQPDLDRMVFTDDGFFQTGDKGEFQANGLLKITGRIKDNFKTSKGKYVAPAPIENRLNAHPMVESAMVGGSGQVAPFAYLVLAQEWRDKLDKTLTCAQVDLEMEELLLAINAELAHYERLQMIVIASSTWSIENGCLTPTLKIKRNRIESMISSDVADWYATGQPVVWSNV